MPPKKAPPNHMTTCEFGPLEVNHDFGPDPVSAADNKSRKFRATIHSHGNKDATGCTHVSDYGIIDNKPSGRIYQDLQGLKEIIGGMSVDELINIEDGDSKQVKVNCMGPTSKTQLGNDQKWGVNDFNAVINVAYPNPEGGWGNNLLKLFPGSREIDDHIFLTIDTGDDVWNNFASTVTVKKQLHIIHDMMTLSDSASKTRPINKKKNKKNNIKLRHWYYKKPYTVPYNDKIFLSRFQVSLNKSWGGGAGAAPPANNPKDGWKISQEWKLEHEVGPPALTITDAHRENNITVIAPLLKKKTWNNGGSQAKVAATMRANSLAIQRKRSGDYFQIYSGKTFPERAEKNHGLFYFCQGDDPQDFKSATNNLNKEEYRKKFFVCTGDWPCFTMLAHQRVNALMVHRSTKRIFSIWFNEPEEPAAGEPAAEDEKMETEA